MAEEEETPIAVNVEIEKKSLLPLQDPWYCSSPLFPMVPIDIMHLMLLPNGIYGVKPQSQNFMGAFNTWGYGFAPPMKRASTFTSAILVS